VLFKFVKLQKQFIPNDVSWKIILIF
jgi:hypothetical protein